MTKQPEQSPTGIGRLPAVGTPQRLEWDLTIREAIELYPDWAAIHVGKGRLNRETYEGDYKDYYEGRGKTSVTGPALRKAGRRPKPTRPPRSAAL